MGTNYYIRYNICGCCNRYNEIHVGKSSFGWSFTFHAPDEYINASGLDPKATLLDNHDIQVKISSYKEWKDFFQKYIVEYETAKMFDEYGEEVSLDEFYEMVEKKRGGKNHAHEMATNPKYSYNYDPDKDFIDEEGNSFSRVDFS